MSTGSSALSYVGKIAAVFAVVGLGLGLTGYVSLGWMQGQIVDGAENEFARSIGELLVTLVFFQSAIVAFFAGPTLAALTGVVTGRSIGYARPASVVTGVGTFLGFYAMVVLAVAIMALGLPAGGGGGDGGGSSASFAEVVGPMLTAGVPTAVVGAATAAIGARF